MTENIKKTYFYLVIYTIIISAVFGGAMGYYAGYLSNSPQGEKINKQINDIIGEEGESLVNEESRIISVVEKTSPAVVSIIVTKDLPKIEQYNTTPFGNDFFQDFFGDQFYIPSIPQYRQNGTEKQEIGGGSGFIVSSDGYIVTNKHVVSDKEAEYTVLLNNEKKYTAKVLARDPLNDVAVLKIDAKDLTTLEFGDDSKLKVGQMVIAIGNALGEYSNTVSTGVISGLSRSITAGGGGDSETLVGVIQTDASINVGNSGGPLLNLKGEVIGINTAIVQGAQNIGFAITINEVKNIVESVKKNGKISRPWLGVRYVLIDETIKESNKLSVDYGALIIRGENSIDLAVMPGSPADKAGLKENDIILEVDGQKIDSKNPLSLYISKHKVGDEIKLKIQRQGENKDIRAKLEEIK